MITGKMGTLRALIIFDMISNLKFGKAKNEDYQKHRRIVLLLSITSLFRAFVPGTGLDIGAHNIHIDVSRRLCSD